MMTNKHRATYIQFDQATTPRKIITPERVELALYVLLCVGVGIAPLLLNPMIIAGVILAGLFLVLIMLYPFLGLLLLYLDLTVAPAMMMPQLGAVHPDQALGGVLLISVMIHKKFKGETFVLFQERMTWLLTFFVGALVATVPTSVWPSGSVSAIINFMTTFMFYLLMVNVLTTEKRLAGFIWLFILLGGYTAISSAIAYFEGNLVVAQGIERAQSLAGADPNSLAVSLVLAIPFMAFAVRWTKRGFLRFVSITLFLASVFTIAITGSRSGVMGLMAVLFFMWLSSKHRMLKLVIFLVAITIGWTVLPAKYKERYSSVTSVTSGEVDPSTQARYDAWGAGLRMFYARPFFGIGVGNFAPAYASGNYSDRGYWLKAHSLYIQLIAELGLVGAVTFVPLVFYMIRRNFRLRKLMRERGAQSDLLRAVSDAITCSTGALIVTSISGHSLFRTHWYWCFAMTVVLWRLFRDANPELLRETGQRKLGLPRA